MKKDEPTPLNEEEMEMCRKAFQMFDKAGNGTIDVNELQAALLALGQTPSDEDLFVMISQVDEDCSREIEFAEFVKAIQINKAMTEKNAVEQDTIDAFVALGGNADKTGTVKILRMKNVLEDFELALDVMKFVSDPEEKTGLEYEEFKTILS
eukprot:gene10184-8091_t